MLLASQIMVSIVFLPSTARIAVTPLAYYARFIEIFSGVAPSSILFIGTKRHTFMILFLSVISISFAV